jgi:hypothetical protein
MTQILKSLQIPVTGSTPSTPPSEFGTLYASQSTGFFYKNPAGTNFNLLAPNGFIITRYYTGSATGSGVTQTYPWTKPGGNKMRYLEVCCVGAGGGGGSGRKSNAGASSQGGIGGGGGAIVWATFDASILSSSYTITLGAGGAGGSGQATSNTSGNSGTDGGTSSFGTLVIAQGGQGGAGGGLSGIKRVGGGLATSCTPAGYPHAYTGCNSATMPNVPTNPVNNAPSIFNISPQNADLAGGPTVSLGFGGASGGSGGSFASAVISSGSRGSNGYQFTTLVTNGGNPGTGSGQNATPPTNNMITTLLQFTGSTTTYGLGGGGHGGGYGVSPNNGGNGSNGGLYGAGGGGGGGISYATALSSSGNGGSGSSGLCIVIEFY